MVRAFLNSQSCRSVETNPQARVIITQNINRKDQSNRLIISIRLIIRGRLIVSVSKHLTAVIDGNVHDIYDCTRNGKRCVYGYFIKETA